MYSSSSDEEYYVVPKKKKERKYQERKNFLGELDFKERFRFSKTGVEELLVTLGGRLEPKRTTKWNLSSLQKLLVSLRFYACGAYYYTNGDCHGLSKGTVCQCVHEVTDLVGETLVPAEIQWPSNSSANEDIGQRFFQKGGLPNVCGCIDGTLINIKAPAPKDIEPNFVDRKGNHSINCMAVCGPEAQFYFACANWPGSANDSRVLRNSSLDKKFSNGWKPFPLAYLLGDSGYPLKEWLQTPIVSLSPTPAVLKFNRLHKRTRRLIECAFGILKQRFQCLYYLRVNPVFAGKIFMACCALHNLLLTEQPPETEEFESPEVILNEFGLEDEADTEDEEESETLVEQNHTDREKGLRRQKQLLNGILCV